MKKLLVLLLSLLLLTACSNSNNNNNDNSNNNETPETKDKLARVLESGKLVIAMEGTWAPWTYHDESDNLVGFDVEVGKYIANYLGVEAEFVEGEWDGLLAGVEAGRYDMLVNGCNITEERQKTYDFSDPYAYDRVAVIVRNDNEDIKSFEDLKDKTTANTITSIYAEIAESYGAKVTPVDDLVQTFLLLEQGRIDATLNAQVAYGDYIKTNPNAPIKVAVVASEADPIAIPMQKTDDNKTFVAKVNEAIADMAKTGKLAEASNTYFGVDITTK